MVCRVDRLEVDVWFGGFLLQQRMSSHCHRRPTLYDLGCVSACFVVGFRLPLNLCLCCLLFLGEAF